MDEKHLHVMQNPPLGWMKTPGCNAKKHNWTTWMDEQRLDEMYNPPSRWMKEDGCNVESTTLVDEKHLDVTQKKTQLNHLDGWQEDGLNIKPTTWMDEKKMDET